MTEKTHGPRLPGMSSRMTILSSWLDAVVDQLELHGLDPKQVTAGIWGHGVARLTPTRQVGLVLARRLWQRAASLTTDQLIGLKVGCGLPMQAMNATGLLMLHSPTLRDALSQLERYQQLVSNSGRVTVNQTAAGVDLRYAVTPCHVEMHYMQLDSLFGSLLTFLTRCSVRKISPLQVALTAQDTRLAHRYADILKCPVTLGAPAVRISYDNQTLDTPFQGADPAWLKLIATHADGLLRAYNSSDSLVAVVRAAISTHGFGSVSCDDVAQSLGITSRTLQRRLSSTGMPFRRLLEAARMDEALFLLTQGSMPLPDIAERLGYSEPSSFWHAVKSCWGATPRELRSDIKAPAGAHATRQKGA